ncbi:MAG: cobalamin-independent methionine synthase II family protein [Pseudomonadota bacterium]
MTITTTTIGAFPKPEYVRLPDWFTIDGGPDSATPTREWAGAMNAMGDDARAIVERGIRDAVNAQVRCGVDIPTDGEIPRENYIHYHCRHLHGFDFDALAEKELRGGTYSAYLPTIRGDVTPGDPFLVADWEVAQSATDRPVKVTLPGPMTISDTVVDLHYGDQIRLGKVLANALNAEVRALVAAGCQHIQIDEPLFARRPADALEFGLENLERAFDGVPPNVCRIAHMCCGYPDRLDNPDYPKADPMAYFELADALDRSSLDAVSLEDAHRPNDLSLLERFRDTTVIFGVVAVAKSDVEPVDAIASRLDAALERIDQDRLWAAPDCGLGLLGSELAVAKLKNLCVAAKRVG